MSGQLSVMIAGVMKQGVLTSESLYTIDHYLRQKQFDEEDTEQLNQLLEGLISGRIHSQSPSVSLYLRQVETSLGHNGTSFVGRGRPRQ